MNELERSSLLIGQEALDILAQKTVLVVGCGGVGGMCIEALARSGIGRLILVDHDTIEGSNINRQLIATAKTIGQIKTEAWKERIRILSKNTKVISLNSFYDKTMNEELEKYSIDFIIDCIDSIQSKKDLIQYGLNKNIPFICSMGMARRKDPSLLEVMEIEKTGYDPMAKQIRTWKRKEKIKKKIMVVASKEIPIPVKKGQPLPSMIFVPAAAGLVLAQYCLDYLTKNV